MLMGILGELKPWRNKNGIVGRSDDGAPEQREAMLTPLFDGRFDRMAEGKRPLYQKLPDRFFIWWGHPDSRHRDPDHE